MIARWQADRLRRGAGASGVVKALVLLGSILETACEAEHIATNPVRSVRKARPPHREEVRPLAPATVEARAHHCAFTASIHFESGIPKIATSITPGCA
ncbi:MAG TPA: hypothetical protein VEF89_05340 [Solirubrobacteraceae bacterium]|nr:hypothetical protein [Solirubrobacteraceae bacterium]